MDLILWRHCDAAPGVPDELRPLTPLGAKQAERMARWLDLRLPGDCRVVVSPALRAQQTAQSLRRPFETDRRLASGATAEAVLAAANASDAAVVLVVAHQPSLGRCASLLLEGEPRDRAMQTGEVLWIAGVAEDGRAALAHAVTPQFA